MTSPGAPGPGPSGRCSDLARSLAIDPIGSAGAWSGVVLVQHPLPWPPDVGRIPGLGGPAVADLPPGWRVQALVPGDHGPALLRYARPAGPSFTALARDGGGDGHDVLVCTHGSRDACCGSLGTKLFPALAPAPGVRYWRTSHLGGHRFAPTALVLPEGSAWAYLTPPLLDGIVRRTASIEDVLPHYRGCVGLAGPEVQVAERELLRRVGWELFDRPRSGRVVERGDDRVRVRIASGAPGGGRSGGSGPALALDVEVRVGRRIAVPACGQGPDAPAKVETEYAVGAVSRSSG